MGFGALLKIFLLCQVTRKFSKIAHTLLLSSKMAHMLFLRKALWAIPDLQIFCELKYFLAVRRLIHIPGHDIPRNFSSK
jgi:hypothetical protein